jgi:tetratricopeptide (TPR) repeat protein
MTGAAAVVAFAVVSFTAGQPAAVDGRLAERHYKEGVLLMRAERWEEGASQFRAAIEIDPLMALAHYNLGQCRMAQKRFAAAVAAYQGAREAFQGLATRSQKERDQRDRARRDEIGEIKTSLARLHLAKGPTGPYAVQLEDRLRTLQAMDGRDRSEQAVVPGEVLLALGSAYFRQDKLADAEIEWKAAVEANRKLGQAYNNLAVVYMMTGRKTEAEEAVRAAEHAGFSVNPGLKNDIRNMGF